MLSTLLLTLAVGFVSSFYPGLPVEPYLVGVVAAADGNAVLLGVAASLGQCAGKTGMFLAARGTIRIPALQRWMERHRGAPEASGEPGRPERRWRRALRRLASWSRALAPLDRPALAAPAVMLSALVGLPPLLLMTFAAAATSMRTTVFVAACLAGRTIRFVGIALTPAAAGVLFG